MSSSRCAGRARRVWRRCIDLSALTRDLQRLQTRAQPQSTHLSLQPTPQTSPELFGKLLLGEDMTSARSTTLPAATKQGAGGAAPGRHQSSGGAVARTSSSGGARSGPGIGAGGRASGGAAALRSASAGRHRGAAFDTPRGFGDEGLTKEQELAIELDSVKRERERLLEAIAHVKGSAGTAGGEAQQADIQQLLRELEMKKAKLNELQGEAQR
jgi:hypothetical protein